jgi:hypothetical protein
MKQFILLLLFVLIQFAGFSQSHENQAQTWNRASGQVNGQPDLAIFPNPCTGQKLTIEISKGELTEIRVSNIAGKLVMFKQFVIPVNKVELTLENTPNGIYLIQVKTSDHKLVAKKLIVTGR